MIDKEIVEGNEFINIFLGIDSNEFYKTHSALIAQTKGNYHKSWDWLMPVIKKIREIINVELNIDSFEEIRERKLTLNPYDYDMEQVYKAVVEFIKWYNQNKE